MIAGLYKNLFPKSEFGRNVFVLLSGTLLSQVVTVALSPILSRLFSPAEFGLFSVFSTVAGTGTVIATFRYELAIMLPEKDEDAFNLLCLSVLISLGLGALFFVGSLLFSDILLSALNATSISRFAFLIPVYVFFGGLSNALNYWISRKKNFRLISAGKISQSSGTAVSSILLSFTKLAHGGLITGAVIGQTVIGLLYSTTAYKDWLVYRAAVSKQKMKELLKRYIHFLTFNSPHAFLNNLQDLVVVLLIQKYFGAAAAGFYFFSYRILRMPIGIIGSSTYQVFYQKSSSLNGDGKAIQSLMLSIYKKMLLVGVPCFGVIAVGGPWLFSFIFGKEWYDAGVVSQLLSPYLFLTLIISPVSAIAVVMNKQPVAILFGITDLILRCTSIYIGGVQGNFFLGIGIMSASISIMMLYAMWWYYRLPLSKNVKQY